MGFPKPSSHSAPHTDQNKHSTLTERPTTSEKSNCDGEILSFMEVIEGNKTTIYIYEE